MFTLNAYAARTCPVKTHNAFHPGMRLPPADEAPREGGPGGITFRAEIQQRLLTSFTGSVWDGRALAERSLAEQEQAASEAMAAGVEVLVQPLLPRDLPGHRSGRPDLLLRAADGGYHAAEIKSHRVLNARPSGAGLQWSALADPLRRQELPGYRFRYGWRHGDLIQLAHYQRMLRHLGQAAAEPLGAMVGTDDVPGMGRVLTWVDLAAAELPAARRVPGLVEPVKVSALARYDAEQAFRIEVAERASALTADDPPALLPIVSRECDWCPWWEVCRPLLDDDDLSLRLSKSPLDVHEIQVLRDLGVTTVPELASRDIESLLPDYLPLITHRRGAEERLRLAWRRSTLMANGLDFDRITAGPVELPRASVEIDLDIETSPDDRVYLWGFGVSDARDQSRYYRHFSAFDRLDDEAERDLAEAAMSWLRGLVDGGDTLVFHYSDYEVLRLQRLAAATESATLDWAVSWAGRHFVDLFPIIRTHFFGTHGLGLKAVAGKAAGFTWRDPDPGGLNSLGWFDQALDGDTVATRAAARTRVLEYNEDDVDATRQVRRWLRSLGKR